MTTGDRSPREPRRRTMRSKGSSRVSASSRAHRSGITSLSSRPSMSPCRTGSRTAGSECVPAVRHRLDNELVLRGLARSRRHAADLVVSGRVFVDELPVTKTSTPIAAEQQVSVEHPPDAPDFASRGGYKLAGVLDRLGPGGPQVEGRSCLDAGASVSYTHLRAHETRHDLVCRLLLEKKKKKKTN